MAIFDTLVQFRAIIPQVHKNFPFEGELLPVIERAADRYLLPLLGAEYTNLDAASSPTTDQAALLPHVRKALAFYAYYDALTANSVHLASMGITESRSSDGVATPASGWVRNDARLQASTFADFYLERLLAFLEDAIISDGSKYQSWRESQAYQDRFSLYIWRAEHLSDHIPGLSEKWRMFYAIRAAIKWVQERDVEPLLQGYATTLTAACKNQATADLSADQQTLLSHIRPYLACRSFLEAIPFQRVNHEQGGIFFRTYDGPISRQLEQANVEALRALESRLETKAAAAWTSLQRYLDDNEDKFAGFSSQKYYYPDGDNGYQPTIIKTRGGIVL